MLRRSGGKLLPSGVWNWLIAKWPFAYSAPAVSRASSAGARICIPVHGAIIYAVIRIRVPPEPDILHTLSRYCLVPFALVPPGPFEIVNYFVYFGWWLFNWL